MMIFYNGFNLLIDIALATAVFFLGSCVGFQKGKELNKPPF